MQKLRLDDEKKVGLVTNESKLIPLEKRPRISRLVEAIPNAKFATLGFLSNLIALEVYKELVASGLYLNNPDLKFTNMLNNTFDLFRSLKTNYGRKGKVVVNHLGTLLGIKIIADQKLIKIPERRQYIINSLNLLDMQVGLDDSMQVADINPEDFFDKQLDSKQRLRKVDTNSYYVIVRSLDRIQEKYKDDPYVINWCAIKLRQLEEFEKSLEAQWLSFSGVRENKRLSNLKRYKQKIYKREKTK